MKHAAIVNVLLEYAALEVAAGVSDEGLLGRAHSLNAETGIPEAECLAFFQDLRASLREDAHAPA